MALIAVGLALASQGATAAIDWVGTADYSAVGGDTVNEMHSYDFGPGSTLLHNTELGRTVLNPEVNDVIQGYLQTYVSDHLDLGGTPITSPNLITSGSGTGYELTLRADFTDKVTSATGSAIGFDVTGGNWELYFHNDPNYSFAGDSGFTDGSAILSGTILNGAGNATIFEGGLFGVSTIDLLVTSFDASIFEPDTILAGSSVFTLQLVRGATVAASSVQGHSPGDGDLILTADGNLELKAVPIPAAMWLFGSALVGILAVGRRRSMAV